MAGETDWALASLCRGSQEDVYRSKTCALIDKCLSNDVGTLQVAKRNCVRKGDGVGTGEVIHWSF